MSSLHDVMSIICNLVCVGNGSWWERKRHFLMVRPAPLPHMVQSFASVLCQHSCGGVAASVISCCMRSEYVPNITLAS